MAESASLLFEPTSFEHEKDADFIHKIVNLKIVYGTGSESVRVLADASYIEAVSKHPTSSHRHLKRLLKVKNITLMTTWCVVKDLAVRSHTKGASLDLKVAYHYSKDLQKVVCFGRKSRHNKEKDGFEKTIRLGDKRAPMIPASCDFHFINTTPTLL